MGVEVKHILSGDEIDALDGANSPSAANVFATINDVSPIISDVTILKNNEYKVTYYAVVSGASGTITPPTGATINADEFGASGNCVLSKIDGSNKPTFISPTTSGGVVVTASLNTATGAWIASGAYTDTSVALIYSLEIKGIDYHNLTFSNIVETIALTGITSVNTLTAPTQTFATGNSGSDFAISSTGSTHTFNIPDAGASARGAVTTTAQTFAGDKTFTGKTTISNPVTNITNVTVSATPTYTLVNGQTYSITGLNLAITNMSTNATGTLSNGDMVLFMITDNGVARAISWGALYASTTDWALPTTTVAGKMINVVFKYNSANSLLECYGIVNQ